MWATLKIYASFGSQVSQIWIAGIKQAALINTWITKSAVGGRASVIFCVKCHPLSSRHIFRSFSSTLPLLTAKTLPKLFRKTTMTFYSSLDYIVKHE